MKPVPEPIEVEGFTYKEKENILKGTDQQLISWLFDMGYQKLSVFDAKVKFVEEVILSRMNSTVPNRR